MPTNNENPSPQKVHQIGLIADTHGLLRPEVKNALAGSEFIIHAGDIGSPEVLRELEGWAKVYAVRGNVDWGEWAREIPDNSLLEWGGTTICVTHNLPELNLDLAAAGVDLVVYGHSHQAVEKTDNGILYVNPGGAGPKRFKLPATVAIIRKRTERIEVEFIYL